MAPRIERKLAAILAAEVVGYSRLVGADEAGTIARLKTLRKEFIEPLTAEYRGRIVKLMGDGALVEFASALDAVECAVAIQNGVAEREAAEPQDRRIQFRIGINVGDIIVEDGDILGDGVNVAARLEGLAAPGGICLSQPVHAQRASSTFRSSPWASTGSRISPSRSRHSAWLSTAWRCRQWRPDAAPSARACPAG
jgi:adenylate cyclase